jgi:hypothetical protein
MSGHTGKERVYEENENGHLVLKYAGAIQPEEEARWQGQLRSRPRKRDASERDDLPRDEQAQCPPKLPWGRSGTKVVRVRLSISSFARTTAETRQARGRVPRAVSFLYRPGGGRGSRGLGKARARERRASLSTTPVSRTLGR